MSALVTVTGLVLHTVRHGETSLILTVFSRELGKLGLMAKGARSRSKVSATAALELLCEGQFVLYRKAGRELQLLKEWTLLDPHRGLRTDFDRLTVASAVAELLAKCVREYDPHPELYALACGVLTELDRQPAFPLPLLWLFELRLFRELGFELTFSVAGAGGATVSPPYPGAIRYRLSDGTFFLSGVAPAATDGELSTGAFAILSALAASSAQFAARVAASARVQREITLFLAHYLETHLPVTGNLRSLKALSWGKAD